MRECILISKERDEVTVKSHFINSLSFANKKILSTVLFKHLCITLLYRSAVKRLHQICDRRF